MKKFFNVKTIALAVGISVIVFIIFYSIKVGQDLREKFGELNKSVEELNKQSKDKSQELLETIEKKVEERRSD